MAFRMSEQARIIKIYNLLAGTNEFVGESDAYIPPHTGLPVNGIDMQPVHLNRLVCFLRFYKNNAHHF